MVVRAHKLYGGLSSTGSLARERLTDRAARPHIDHTSTALTQSQMASIPNLLNGPAQAQPVPLTRAGGSAPLVPPAPLTHRARLDGLSTATRARTVSSCVCEQCPSSARPTCVPVRGVRAWYARVVQLYGTPIHSNIVGGQQGPACICRSRGDVR
jgi:hypothetical protein